ncbi:ankyrin repeat domain-containing protein [Actinoplanes sp. NPDC051343]|uniref:ankyrin repeat domain-containing protein n=1 Tax=Actinoplanes sp. NPDC051343 TaxID=3363906 RepID=UPI0037987896
MDDLDPDLAPPLHEAARQGLPLPVVERRLVGDVDARWRGRTALWEAVMHRHYEVAKLLAEAGADPWAPLIGGWSPGRLALAGPHPTLFGAPDSHLTTAEMTAIARARRRIAAVGDPEVEGMSIACLAHVDSAEAAGRLRALPVDIPNFVQWAEDPWSEGMTDDEVLHTVGVTDVPGGCVVTQWAGFTAAAPGLLARLTPGSSAYAMSVDPRGGCQGIAFHHGHLVAADLSPGSGDAGQDDTGSEVLRAYLYYGHPVAYCCDAAGLSPEDQRPFIGPPTKLLRLPPMMH